DVDGRSSRVGGARKQIGIGNAHGLPGISVIEVEGGTGSGTLDRLGCPVDRDIETELPCAAGVPTPATHAASLREHQSPAGLEDRFTIYRIVEADPRSEVLPERVNGRFAVATDARSAVVAGKLHHARCTGDAVGQVGIEEAPVVLCLVERLIMIPSQAKIDCQVLSYLPTVLCI